MGRDTFPATVAFPFLFFLLRSENVPNLHPWTAQVWVKDGPQYTFYKDGIFMGESSVPTYAYSAS